MKKGAYYITSGILDVKEEVVVEAVKAAGLTVVEVTHQGEWVSVTASSYGISFTSNCFANSSACL